MWQIEYLPAEILWNSSRSRLAAATVHRTYEIAILNLIEPSVVNIDSYVMKGMSNGHDKSALLFGYGVNSHQLCRGFPIYRQNRKRDEHPLVVVERP